MRPRDRAFRFAVPVGVATALLLALQTTAWGSVSLTTVSSDGFSNTTSFHRTTVEPDTFANGSTVVAAFQVGRFSDGGSSDIGWATTANGGGTWSNGTMPGMTPFSSPTGAFGRVTDPSVAYDAKDNVWMVSSIGLVSSGGVRGTAVLLNRSTTSGTSWGNPVTIRSTKRGQDFDKNWTACDDTASSPFYGTCYTEWDDFGHNNQLHMAVSTDGGLTWKESSVPRRSSVIGGQPVVQPSGRVVVPIDDGSESHVESFVSTNGGTSFAGPYPIASIVDHFEAGNLRSGPLVSADVDSAGTVYVAWADCRFVSSCGANDIVMSTSTDGTTWTAPARIPIDSTSSGVDHFLPGFAVEPGTSGGSAHIGVTYYYFPTSGCGSTCQLDVGYVSSSDGGSTWTGPTQLAGPMQLSWLPMTTQGYMVGDYMSTSFAGSSALPVFANAHAVGGKTCTLGDVTSCDESMAAPSTGLAVAQVTTLRTLQTHGAVTTRSDHPARAAVTWR